MKLVTLALAAAIGLAAPALAQTAASAAPSAAKYGLDTPIEGLIGHPPAKAVIDKHIPGLATNENYEMFKSMTLRNLSQMSDKLTPETMAKVEADLAKLH